MKTKCILNLNVARYLLNHRCKLVDVDTSSRRKGFLVFIFEVDEHFNETLSKYEKGVYFYLRTLSYN